MHGPPPDPLPPSDPPDPPLTPSPPPDPPLTPLYPPKLQELLERCDEKTPGGSTKVSLDVMRSVLAEMQSEGKLSQMSMGSGHGGGEDAMGLSVRMRGERAGDARGKGGRKKGGKRRRGGGRLPAHCEVVEVVHDAILE